MSADLDRPAAPARGRVWPRRRRLPVRPRRTLRRRLSMLVAVSAATTMLLSLLGVLTLGWVFQEQRLQNESDALAAATAFALEAPLTFHDGGAVAEALQMLRVRQAVLSAWVYDRDDRLVAHYVRDTAGGAPSTRTHLGPAADDVGPVPRSGRILAVAAVHAQQDPVGYVVLETDSADAYRQLGGQAAAVLAAMLVSFLVALALVRRFARRVSEPVARLAGAASHIAAAGDYTQRIEAAADDEVGRAVQAFNAMLDVVQQGHRELEAANAGLELRVAERTAALARETARAEAASLAKTRFLANMSHELRTPLNAVLGAVQLMQQARDGAERAQLVEVIGQSGASLLGLIENVLDLSRIEAGMLELEALDFNLHDCIEAAVSTAAVQARAKGLTLNAIIDPALGPWRHGDAVRLRQVLLNLLGNAVKFTASGEVTLHADADGATGLRVAVHDTGVGMDLQAGRDIFEPFAQADETTTRRFGGTGLGLSISRQLVREMGGDIRAHSTPRQGSVFEFTIELPLARASHPPVPPSRARVFWFEPHEPSARALHSLLERMGVQAVRVDSAQALQQRLAHMQAPGRAHTSGSTGATGEEDPDAAPWLLVATGSPQADTLLGTQGDRLRPDRVIAMSPAPTQGAEASRSVVKPVLRATLVSRLGLRRTKDGLADAAPPEDADVQPGTRSVLVVEDDPTNQMIVTTMLRNAGYAVRSADGGHDALALLREAPFDLVLMDWQMPDIDGLEVTRRIRAGDAGEAARQVPIAALTANAFAEDRAACLAVGMNDFLTKPIVVGDLLRVARRWCNTGAVAGAERSAR